MPWRGPGFPDPKRSQQTGLRTGGSGLGDSVCGQQGQTRPSLQSSLAPKDSSQSRQFSTPGSRCPASRTLRDSGAPPSGASGVYTAQHGPAPLPVWDGACSQRLQIHRPPWGPQKSWALSVEQKKGLGVRRAWGRMLNQILPSKGTPGTTIYSLCPACSSRRAITPVCSVHRDAWRGSCAGMWGSLRHPLR